MSKLTDRSTAPKKLSKTDKKAFWRAKKKIAYQDLKQAKKTNNIGWVKMLHKRINSYDKRIGESFNDKVNYILKSIDVVKG